MGGRRVSVTVGVTAGTVKVREGKFVIVAVIVGDWLGVAVLVRVAVADAVPVVVVVGVNVSVGVMVWVGVSVVVGVCVALAVGCPGRTKEVGDGVAEAVEVAPVGVSVTIGSGVLPG